MRYYNTEIPIHDNLNSTSRVFCNNLAENLILASDIENISTDCNPDIYSLKEYKLVYTQLNVKDLLSEVAMRLDTAPKYYTKEDYLSLIKLLLQTLLYLYGDFFEDKLNLYKTTSWNNPPLDSKIPSEKLVKDSLDKKLDTLINTVNIKSINNNSLLGSGNLTIGYDVNDDFILTSDENLEIQDYGIYDYAGVYSNGILITKGEVISNNILQFPNGLSEDLGFKLAHKILLLFNDIELLSATNGLFNLNEVKNGKSYLIKATSNLTWNSNLFYHYNKLIYVSKNNSVIPINNYAIITTYIKDNLIFINLENIFS